MYQSQRGNSRYNGPYFVECNSLRGGGDSRYNGPYFVQCTSLRGGIVGTVVLISWSVSVSEGKQSVQWPLFREVYQSQRGGGIVGTMALISCSVPVSEGGGIVGTMALISCSVPVSEGGGDSRYNGPYFVQCTSLRGG